MAARLEALENDAAAQDAFAGGSDDDEFELREGSDGGTHFFHLAHSNLNNFLEILPFKIKNTFYISLTMHYFSVF